MHNCKYKYKPNQPTNTNRQGQRRKSTVGDLIQTHYFECKAKDGIYVTPPFHHSGSIAPTLLLLSRKKRLLTTSRARGGGKRGEREGKCVCCITRVVLSVSRFNRDSKLDRTSSFVYPFASCMLPQKKKTFRLIKPGDRL